MKNWMLFAGLALGCAAPTALAAEVLQPAILTLDPGAAATTEDDYLAGTRAMNEQRWQDAISIFDKMIDAKDAKADAALYWKAYALNKLGRREASAATCGQLRGEFPKSSWIKDCAALGIGNRTVRVVVRSKDGQTTTSTSSSASGSDDDTFVFTPVPPVPPSPASNHKAYSYSYSYNNSHSESSDPDTDLKILALNSLMHQDASKAIPVIRGIFNGSQPDKLKRQAMFVLAQNKAPECQALLREVALGKQSPTLQREAIQQLAISQGKKANDTIAEIYKQSSDEKVKRSAISAMFISGDAQKLVELARSEKNLEMKRNIVQQLALMNDKAAQDYMLELLK